MAQRHTLSIIVIGAMLAGIAVGLACNLFLDGTQVELAVAVFATLTDIFLRLIKLVVAPLVFATLVAGIAHMGDAAAVGRIGAKTMAWFIFASLVSLALGLVLVDLIAPGVGISLPRTDESSVATGIDTSGLSVRQFIVQMVPSSIVAAMADNEILQIVVFSVLLGTAAVALGERAALLLQLVEQIAALMLKITAYVMWFAPVAVFAALAAAVAQQGAAILADYARFVGGFYLAMTILWLLLLLAAWLAVGRRTVRLLAAIRTPVVIGFATASSEATYPRTLQALEGFGLPTRIVRFVLPLGYSFNLDGSMLYCAFAIMFIAQAQGLDLPIGQQVSVMLLLLVTSKGMAGVPRASLVVVAATLSHLGLPQSGLLLVLAVDQLLDMGRTATNVVGNSVAAVIVSRWEQGRETAGAIAQKQEMSGDASSRQLPC